MAAYSINPQDRKDLNKFTKFLAFKSAQIIVQSRQGSKIETKCRPQASGVDWFNLSIQDFPHVTEATKKAFLGDGITISQLPLCVEISLRTVDGDEMVLETWTLDLMPELCDPSMKVMCTVYYRMGILLKSLISVTRITPAYKLSRRQSTDSYAIFYDMYTGQPDTQCLGEGFKKIKVGQLCTPIGTISMMLLHRTKMTISPTNIKKKSEDSMMVKSDHFNEDLSPKNLRNNIKKESNKVIDLNKPLRAGAFVDMEKIKEFVETISQQLPSEPRSSWLFKTSTMDKKTLLDGNKQPVVETENAEMKSKNNTNIPENSGNNPQAVGKVPEYLPELSNPGPSSSRQPGSIAIDVPTNSHVNKKSAEYIMNELLNCPFAENSYIRDLAEFYHMLINKENLDLDNEPGAMAEFENLDQQFIEFEELLDTFEKLSIATSDSDEQ